MEGFEIWFDTSEVVACLERLSGLHEVGTFHAMMQRTFMESGRHARPVIRKEILKEYEVKASWVNSKIGAPAPASGEIGCVIPINSTRGTIGGIYRAVGGATKVQSTNQHMRDGTVRKRREHMRYRRISAHIVKGAVSEMPSVMSHQGGQPPFRNGGGIAFTRTTPARLPIASVVGLGVPQMPLNRAKPAIVKEIVQYTMKRLKHNYEHMIGGTITPD